MSNVGTFVTYIFDICMRSTLYDVTMFIVKSNVLNLVVI